MPEAEQETLELERTPSFGESRRETGQYGSHTSAIH